MALLLDLRSTGAAATRTPGHLNLTRTPIDLQVVLMKPGVSQYHVLVAKAGLQQSEHVWRDLRTGDHVYHLGDGPHFIGRTITLYTGMGCVRARVVSWFLPNVIPVDEESVSSAVKKCLHGLGPLLVSVVTISTFMFQGVCRGDGSDYVLPWKPSFPTF